MSEQSLIDSLTQLVGAENLLTAPDDLLYFSQDVFSQGDLPLAVVQPADKHQLAATVKLATDHDFAVVPRGGGMSYTSGYLSNRKAVMFDMRRMTKIVELNLDDMYVTVEAGCRWVDLYEALKNKGVKTPMWGTLSGMSASIGGGASQNSVFFGSGQNGSSADSIIGMEVVTAQGDIITTGSGAVDGGLPFFRHFGPDLTGLFTGDTGALAIKATLTLQLVPDKPHKRFVSFDFADYEGILAAMADVSRQGLASECFGFDPFLKKQRMKRENLAKDVQTLGKVIRSGEGIGGKIKSAAELVLAGREFMEHAQYSLHVVASEMTAHQAETKATRIAEIGAQAGGKKIANSIPKVVHAHPFTPLNNMIGPQGERWLPVHCLVPHSRVIALYQAVEAFFDDNQAMMAEHSIETGCLMVSVGHSASLIEPVFFWPDALMEFHRRHVESAVLNRIEGFAANDAAREAVLTLREGLLDVFAGFGGTHFQIGRTYRYAKLVRGETLDLVRQMKKALDPKGLMNPGSLGLD